MTINELEIIVDALSSLKHQSKSDRYWKISNLYDKYLVKLSRKQNNGYLVIRGSRSGYSGQSNCDRGTRRIKAIKMSKQKAQKHLGHHTQRFDDGSCNNRSYTFETERPKDTNNRLGGYERRFKEQGLLH